MLLTIIIPTLNEEDQIGATLANARAAAPGSEIIVVDGGSDDATLDLVPEGVRIVRTAAGRGFQINAGASEASGELLLFLHADTRLPSELIEPLLCHACSDARVIGGNFRLRFEPRCWEAALLEAGARLVRRFGVFYGDSAIFVRRTSFLARGGVRRLHLMEDVELVRWMVHAGRTVEIAATVTSSSRRFRGKLWAYLPIWILLQTLDAIGASDRLLARFYSKQRTRTTMS